MGGVFVVETVSVMLQVASYKLTGKRIFRMAPIHHHFELKGWPEPRVIVRFWIISIILALIGWTFFGGPVWAWIGVVPLATGLIGFCPVYPLIGFSSKK